MACPVTGASAVTAKRLVVGVDIDEVIFQFHATFHKWAMVAKGVTIDASELDHNTGDYALIYGVSNDDMQRWFGEFYTSEAFRLMPLVEGTHIYLPRLSQLVDIVCITARTHLLEEYTTECLKQLFPGCIKSIQYGNHYGFGVRRTKAEMCQEVGAAYMVDDNVHYVQSCRDAGIEAILFGHYPWNVNGVTGVRRIANWSELYYHFTVVCRQVELSAVRDCIQLSASTHVSSAPPLDELDIADPDWMMRDPCRIIGFAGCMYAGKNKSATLIAAQLSSTGDRCVEHSFAWSLKEGIGRGVFALRDEQMYGTKEQKEAIDPRWGMSARKIMQLAGTEAFRNTFGSSIWVRSAFARLQKDAINLFTDVRFIEEAEAIHKAGGFVFLVARDGADPWELGSDPAAALKRKHSSETALVNYTNWDGIIVNNGRELYPDDPKQAIAHLDDAVAQCIPTIIGRWPADA